MVCAGKKSKAKLGLAAIFLVRSDPEGEDRRLVVIGLRPELFLSGWFLTKQTCFFLEENAKTPREPVAVHRKGNAKTIQRHHPLLSSLVVNRLNLPAN